jgi:hypothetical protein
LWVIERNFERLRITGNDRESWLVSDWRFSLVNALSSSRRSPLARARARGLSGVLRHGGPLLFRFLPKQSSAKNARTLFRVPHENRSLALGSRTHSLLWVPRVIGRSPTERHHAKESNRPTFSFPPTQFFTVPAILSRARKDFAVSGCAPLMHAVAMHVIDISPVSWFA